MGLLLVRDRNDDGVWLGLGRDRVQKTGFEGNAAARRSEFASVTESSNQISVFINNAKEC